MNKHFLTISLLVASIITISGFMIVPQLASATEDSPSASEVASVLKGKGRNKQTPTTEPTAPEPSAPSLSPIVTEPTAPVSTTSPRGQNLYVSPALTQLGRAPQIASQATATWLGAWSGDIRMATDSVVSSATSQGKLATLVVYNIPVRDCGSYSAGGANSSDGYKEWIRQLAAGIGNRQAIVILEPDALAQITCLSESDQAARYANLSDAVNVLATQTKAFVYLDAGHSAWLDTATATDRLKKANIAQARGFALNVSNFQTSANSTAYGEAIAAATGKHFVIDTSRNGNGPSGEWCNPRGRALGERPTTNAPGNIDAYLWVKIPGESDGTCNGGPSAGQWWEEYAQELIKNAGL